MKKVENCLIKINDALFRTSFRRGNVPNHVFKNPIKSFDLFPPHEGHSFWGILGPGRSAFLKVLAGQYLPDPPLSRSYPFLGGSQKSGEIKLLNFRENSGLDKVHVSARYESYSFKGALEMSDDVNSVLNYITGANNYNNNVSPDASDTISHRLLKLFNLTHLSRKWINSLSNGQMRRARIAKALYSKPKLLIIDDPFLGLDPEATKSVANSLKLVADELNTSIVVGLRIQDQIPEWISHLAFVDDLGLVVSGEKERTFEQIVRFNSSAIEIHQKNAESHNEGTFAKRDQLAANDPIIQFDGASVIYKGIPVLKDFYWTVERGSKWRIHGINGSGKTTLLSLITADHPQSWRSVISINGVLRKTGSGVNYFDINNKIGVSSPELHAVVPSYLTMREIILNGLVPNIGNSNFKFAFKDSRLPIHAQDILQHFEDDISSEQDKVFSELTVSKQKLALFLRALIKKPEILILDEAFSCMDDEILMLKCHEFLNTYFTDATILSIGHLDWELPKYDYMLKLSGDDERSYEILQKRT